MLSGNNFLFLPRKRKEFTGMALGPTEMKILKHLQADARVTNQELAEKIGMSASPCWRKVRKLEEEGVIQGYRAVLNRKKIGLGVMVFIRVAIDSHSEADAKKFEQEVTALEDVVACYSVGGDADFLLQVVASDLDSYAEFAMAVVRRLPGIKEMQSMFVLKEIKPLVTYPLKKRAE
ncbi:Leucine-responsive regulatory protein [Erwinia amylovora ACW56400]|uniref:Leucine-responsive regulatory protein n=4 Tax=Erwinia amylovora TaxID=552 RepID=A0A831A2E3_ERWAM|nr:Leucine-responsive regulatory protein [Erwinia amylovora ACW56400]CBA21253.1 Leucine-responsive regulatory protein [Erwinia amylovora CFBP1430]CBX81072.1 Leucine-responsive regulatory protein [Erwinia amylovora ATCC BAA-2158]CCO86631.1 Leucine-responsive regulatory protein [Erwinia amylovora CFBP 2585]CCO90420.1 Leucine-responsive regulatory protein [Erwinia amylovora 01SFR-BO]CCO94188.1 Leucine-responsive regulatory protein [Erwinia amylovora NBRC 12687 = CFBP 1232]CCO99533.1 Leucine-resp